MKWLMLFLGIATNASASFLIKLAATAPRQLPRLQDPAAALSNWPFWLGLLLYGCTFVIYALALAQLPLSVAHPVMTSGAIAAVAVLSVVVLGESMSRTTALGIAFVILGVVLIVAQRN